MIRRASVLRLRLRLGLGCRYREQTTLDYSSKYDDMINRMMIS